MQRSVRPWGEGKRMGGRQLGRHSGMNPWPEILAMLLRNAIFETWTFYLARSASFREAADVLCTYRRAAGWLRKAESEGQQGFFAAITAPCPKKP